MQLDIKSRGRLTEQLNITPLIDVVFILLIFFMLTSNFLIEEGLDVSLPDASSAQQLSEQFKTIGIDAAGVIHVDGRIVTISELETRVTAVLSGNRDQGFIIKSDQAVHVALLVQVIDALKRSGASNLTIQTEFPQ